MTTDSVLNASKRVSNAAHPNCVVCGPDNRFGLQLEFTASEDGGVQAAFDCSKTFQGYPGLIHGGVISALLDGAMTNCLFAHGRQGITGELRVRFRHPVVTNRPATVRAWIDQSTPPLHVLQAELVQEESVKAKATGKFMERSDFEAKRRQV
ncbi:MAG: PaaI family thioesterase [Pirellulales bacterium]|nr:PaaI family thioesterase [Pirellulales bacterium]